MSSDSDPSENQVYSMYTIRNGAVMEVPIRTYVFDGMPDYPVVMSNGSLRAAVGFGHVPGYAYLKLINGSYVQVDVLTPPCNSAIYTQKDYEHIHYDDEYYTQNYPDEKMKREIITAEEFDRRIEELNGGAEPVKLEIRSLLTFGQQNDLSVDWLDAPADKMVSVPLPKVLTRIEELQAKQAELLQSEQMTYKWQIDAFNEPDAVFNTKQPEKRYYAFYDLDGNGDNELFFGDADKSGKIFITDVWYWTNSEQNGRHDLHIGKYNLARLKDTRVLSNGRVVSEYVISEGTVSNCLLRYQSLSETSITLWRYGQEAAFYDYPDDPSASKFVSLTPEAYERQRAEIEKGASTVKLDWKPLEDYGK